MKITEVRIFKKADQDKKLRAFATVTFDNCFVVRDIKVIDGHKGLFVAMPSRRLREPCPQCHHLNEIRSHFCSQCGKDLPEFKVQKDVRVHQNEHRDIAHPITVEFREYVQQAVLEAFAKAEHQGGDEQHILYDEMRPA